jgi:hypothetical protein
MNMKRIEFLVLAAAATGFLAVPVAAQSQSDVSGSWELTLPPPPTRGEEQPRHGDQQRPRQRGRPRGERPNGPPAMILNLEQNGELLTGTAETERGNVQIENGTIKGDTVTLMLKMTGPDGQERVLELQGRVEGDEMVGALAGGPPRGESRRGGGGSSGPGWQAQKVNR